MINTYANTTRMNVWQLDQQISKSTLLFLNQTQEKNFLHLAAPEATAKCTEPKLYHCNQTNAYPLYRWLTELCVIYTWINTS